MNSRQQLKLPIAVECRRAQWIGANKDVVWGWKRDDGRRQRVIFFSGSLVKQKDGRLILRDWCFYYRHRAEGEAMSRIFHCLRSEPIREIIGEARIFAGHDASSKTVELAGGPGLLSKSTMLRRMMQRRPRRGIPGGTFPTPCDFALDIEAYAPFLVYAGSGLSYESGLPTLAQIHETFGVDRLGDESFAFGDRDPIPAQLKKDPLAVFGVFVRLHALAASAEPSESHLRIAQWRRQGIVGGIYTDNIDNLFSQCGVHFERTRGVGIFNDPFNASFAGVKTLLVIGVAADRRSIISAARKRGLPIVVVNPALPVSPRSQNLSYLRGSDIWYKMKASQFFDLTP